MGVPSQEQPQFILLSDPLSTGINDLLAGLDFAYPGSVKIGGLASTGVMNTQSALFYYTSEGSDIGLCYQGTVGLALSGKIIVELLPTGVVRLANPIKLDRENAILL